MPSLLSILPLRPAGVSTEGNLEITWTRGYPSGPPSKTNASWDKRLTHQDRNEFLYLEQGPPHHPFLDAPCCSPSRVNLAGTFFLKARRQQAQRAKTLAEEKREGRESGAGREFSGALVQALQQAYREKMQGKASVSNLRAPPSVKKLQVK